MTSEFTHSVGSSRFGFDHLIKQLFELWLNGQSHETRRVYDWLHGWIDGDVMFPWKLAVPGKNVCKLRQKCRTGIAERSFGDDVVDTLDQVQLDASW